MATNRDPNLNNAVLQLFHLPKEIYTAAMPKAGLSNDELTKILKNLSLTCKTFTLMFEDSLVNLALKKLLQCVVDDDQKTVKKILDCKPQILSIIPSSNWIITSQLTGDQYFAKDALMMAGELRLANMSELLVSYYNKLPQTEIIMNKKSAALAVWSSYEILIPDEYISYVQSLMEIYLADVGERKEDRAERKKAALSLSEKLQKKQFNTELLLLAFYKEFTDMYFNIYNDDLDYKVEYFCAKILSQIQAAVLPDVAKILCLGLTYVYVALRDNKPVAMTPAAENFLMKNGFGLSDFEIDRTYNRYFYYHSPEDDRYHLGKNPAFFCGISGEITLNIDNIHFAYGMFHDYLKHKQQIFMNLCREELKAPEPILTGMKI